MRAWEWDGGLLELGRVFIMDGGWGFAGSSAMKYDLCIYYNLSWQHSIGRNKSSTYLAA